MPIWRDKMKPFSIQNQFVTDRHTENVTTVTLSRMRTEG